MAFKLPSLMSAHSTVLFSMRKEVKLFWVSVMSTAKEEAQDGLQVALLDVCTQYILFSMRKRGEVILG